jgi:hypothetical protein
MPSSSASGPTPEAKTADGGGAGALNRLTELGWQALPAIGSAIGFAGFVAVIGAAIEWIRFEAAHLPATQAVLTVPKQELVIIGALALSAFVVGAVLAVLLVYIIDSNGDASPGTARGLVAVGVIEMTVTLFFIEVHHFRTYLLLGVWFVVIGIVASYVVASVMRNFQSRSKLKRVGAVVIAAQTRLKAAEVAEEVATAAYREARTDAAAKTREQDMLALLSARREWRGAIREWVAAADEIIAESRSADSALGGGSDDHKGKAREKMETARNGIHDYLDAKPNHVELSAGLDRAERELGHVFRAVADHLFAQAFVVDQELERKVLSPLNDKVLSPLKRKVLSPLNDKVLSPLKRKVLSPLNDKVPDRLKHKVLDPLKHRVLALLRLITQWVRPRVGGEPSFSKLLIATAGAAFCLAFALVGGGIAFAVTERSSSWVAILLGVAAVLATMNLLVARATEKFAWYGLSVFFSVLLFGTALTIARTLDKPKVQPVALLRKGDDVGICGVYITQTNERVYVGRLELKNHRPGLIFWVPTSEVELVDVGQMEHINSKFSKLAAALLAQLYKDRAEEPAQTVKNQTVTHITSGAKAGETTTTVSEIPPSTTPRPTPYPSEGVGANCTSSSPASLTHARSSVGLGGAGRGR